MQKPAEADKVEGSSTYAGLTPGQPFSTTKDFMFTTGDSGLEVDLASL